MLFDFRKNIMNASITLEYDYSDVQAQKTLEYVLSMGLFKTIINGNEETYAEKRKK